MSFPMHQYIKKRNTTKWQYKIQMVCLTRLIKLLLDRQSIVTMDAQSIFRARNIPNPFCVLNNHGLTICMEQLDPSLATLVENRAIHDWRNK